MTKIDVFSGFLGAGKTTLIRKLISEAYSGEKLVLIENEFGEIGIDGGFLADAGLEVTEMNSGCICCSLTGDFKLSLEKVMDQFHPDRILIEPSGVGKLSDVVRAIQAVDNMVVNSLTAVVDASKLKIYLKNFGEFIKDQIQTAGTIILSRTASISDEKLSACLALIREMNSSAALITTPWDELSGMDILNVMENGSSLAEALEALSEDICPECGHVHCHEHEHDDDDDDEHEHEHHHHEHEDDEHEHEHEHEHHHEHGHDHDHHHADEVFTSWGIETAAKFNREVLLKKLTALDDAAVYGVVLRAKGIVSGDDGSWLHFDHVPEENEIRTGSAAVIGRICVIGSELNTAAIAELFNTVL